MEVPLGRKSVRRGFKLVGDVHATREAGGKVAEKGLFWHDQNGPVVADFDSRTKGF